MAEPPIHFIVPGPITQRTGGYGYDRRIIERLKSDGRTVEAVELDGSFPFCCDTARTAAAGSAGGDASPEGASWQPTSAPRSRSDRSWAVKGALRMSGLSTAGERILPALPP